MKSASNSFLMCHLWFDNKMDGPFYSLFHLLCCSKLYFPFPGCFYLKHPFLCDMVIHQGGGSNALMLSGGWGEKQKPHQSFCISSLHCHPACAFLKKKNINDLKYADTHSTPFRLQQRFFSVLNLATWRGSCKIINIFSVMCSSRGRGAGYSTSKS